MGAVLVLQVCTWYIWCPGPCSSADRALASGSQVRGFESRRGAPLHPLVCDLCGVSPSTLGQCALW